MNNRKEYRRVKFLISEVGGIISPINIISPISITKRIEWLIEQYEKIVKEDPKFKPTSIYKKRIKKIFELHDLIKKLNISEEELIEIVENEYNRKLKRKEELEKTPAKETRDNKNVKVSGTGMSYNANPIRYPSLKRSKATWKRFYKLFPNAVKRVKI